MLWGFQLARVDLLATDYATLDHEPPRTEKEKREIVSEFQRDALSGKTSSR